MKKVISYILLIAMIFSLPLNCYAMDEATADDEIEYEGVALLEKLLTKQFDSYKNGRLIDTDALFTPTDSTELYKQYLLWYTGLTAATEEFWTNYEFDLELEKIDGNELTFNASLVYGRTCSNYESKQVNFSYTISISEINGTYYISEIDTEEANFCDFKRLIENATQTQEAIAATAVETDENIIGDLIDSYVNFKNECAVMVVALDDVVDMEETHQAYMDSVDSDVSVQSTSFSYDGERGRGYADTYYSNGNGCFYTATLDCTNFVSQCIWAAYGGWSDGDTSATMSANIASRKRMQSSASLDNWFGHANGIGNPWGSATNLWNFVTGSPATGPKATGKNNNGVWSNISCTEIVTGQVLQFRNGSSGPYAHSVYVSGGTNDSYANIKVNQHTENAQRTLDEVIRGFGSNSCYMRQLVFKTANFDS